MLELARAIELVSKLDRTINYPREGPGVVNLAKGLQRAASVSGIDGDRIAERCAETSQYCPSDVDLLTIAAGLRDEEKRKQESSRDQGAEWRKLYGEPQPFVAQVAASSGNKRHAELWAKIRGKHPHADRLDWMTLSKIARELGYEDYAVAWERSVVR